MRVIFYTGENSFKVMFFVRAYSDTSVLSLRNTVSSSVASIMQTRRVRLSWARVSYSPGRIFSGSRLRACVFRFFLLTVGLIVGERFPKASVRSDIVVVTQLYAARRPMRAASSPKLPACGRRRARALEHRTKMAQSFRFS